MKLVAIITALVLGASIVSAQPGNDNCPSSTPILLDGSPVTGSTGGANTNMLAPCVGSFGADVWFHFTAPYTGTATASTCGATSFDTVVVIRAYPCGITVIACNDDSCGLQSSVSFPITMGATYQVQLGGYGGATGSYTLALTGVPAPVANDHCNTALPISLGPIVTGNNAGATVGPEPTSGCASTNRDVWYSFVAPFCGSFTVSTCETGTNFDTVLGVFQGPCSALTPVACNDDDSSCVSSSVSSRVSFNGLAGVTYYVSVAGFYLSYGTFALTIISSPGAAGMTLVFPNGGPGAIGFSILGGPANGTGFFAATTVPGNYPFGWLFGLDISMNELIGEWQGGYPFVVPLDSCGHGGFGPIGGIPSGFTVYAVALGFPSGSAVVSAHSAAQGHSVP
jgi:hypothetical protein